VRALAAVVAVAAVSASSGCGGGHGTSPHPNVVSKTFICVSDSYVRSNHPHTNYGNNNATFVDGSPLVRGYLSFQPFSRSSKIVRATVRLYSSSTSTDGFQVHATTAGWSETAITYDNAPPVGRLLNLSGPLAKDDWVAIDVTSFVRQNPTSVSLVLVALGPTALTLASRSDQSHAPRLVVEYGR
jgi:hypothetical protein